MHFVHVFLVLSFFFVKKCTSTIHKMHSKLKFPTMKTLSLTTIIFAASQVDSKKSKPKLGGVIYLKIFICIYARKGICTQGRVFFKKTYRCVQGGRRGSKFQIVCVMYFYLPLHKTCKFLGKYST